MRLIDADKMKSDMKKKERELTERFWRSYSRLNEEGRKRAWEHLEMLLQIPKYRKSNDGVCSLLDKQPTAYDVDKVIEQLRNAGGCDGSTEYARGWDDAMEEAERIVAAGQLHGANREWNRREEQFD